jgi:hypothetical protein
VEAARRHPKEIKSLVLMSGETGRDGLQFLHQALQLPELFVFSDEGEYPPIPKTSEYAQPAYRDKKHRLSQTPGARRIVSA